MQAADWHLRLGRNIVGLREQLDSLSDDPMMAHRLDLLGLKAALDDWPTPSPTIRTERDRLRMALVQTLAAMRLIRFAKGTNSLGRADDQDVFLTLGPDPRESRQFEVLWLTAALMFGGNAHCLTEFCKTGSRASLTSGGPVTSIATVM